MDRSFPANLFLFFLPMLSATMSDLSAEETKPETRASRLAAAFARADHDGNQRLTSKEFLANRGQSSGAKRDFRLFDQNNDGFLSPEEFATVPGVVAVEDREPLLDPVMALVDLMVEALDKSFNMWDQRPEIQIDADQFVKSLGDSFNNVDIPLDAEQADPNQDRKISRDEARRLIEILMGVRRPDGQLLREPNGRVINDALFRQIDRNHNDRLERAEFLAFVRTTGDADQEFDKTDQDSDESISFEEWSCLPGLGIIDPIVDFQKLDTNFDRVVDASELLAKVPADHLQVFKTTFPGFDLDQDSRLSLVEYRLTMPANPVLPWQGIPTDRDGDGVLSFAEFQFDEQRFPILRLAYFKRLDLNANNKLEPAEFPHKAKE